PHPALTHTHPPHLNARALGKAINGEPFGERRFDKAIYPHRTVRDATIDLPDIADGHVDTCISHPDHRIARRLRPLLRSMVTNMLPKVPYGGGIYRAAQQ